MVLSVFCQFFCVSHHYFRINSKELHISPQLILVMVILKSFLLTKHLSKTKLKWISFYSIVKQLCKILVDMSFRTEDIKKMKESLLVSYSVKKGWGQAFATHNYNKNPWYTVIYYCLQGLFVLISIRVILFFLDNDW